MSPAPLSASDVIDWAVQARTHEGETLSGDLHVVAPFPDGVLVSVVDGLGHGDEAAKAAQVAAEILSAHAGDDLVSLVERCHTSMRSTRGAVLSVAAFRKSDHTMTWLGVGNVEGVLYHADPAAKPARETLLLRGGVVGYRLPHLRAAVLTVAQGDTLVFATDGIGGRFTEERPDGRAPQDMARDILSFYGKDNDDALALVARYGGGTA